jgi:glycosyltransferase involved in cell wall biosynthesis
MYRNPALPGAYKNDPQVAEFSLKGNVIWWDQVEVPKAVRRHAIDVLYNPKYSIPLNVKCPTAWVCHGLDWYVMPQASRFIDRMSHRFLVPRYAHKADAIVAVSEITKQHVHEFLKVPLEKIHTIYSGVGAGFWKRADARAVDGLNKLYDLPERFFLYSGAIYPPKNFTRMVTAYAQVGPKLGIPLVIAGGENRFLSGHELKVPEQLGLGNWVRWLGWVEPSLLPVLYQRATALLLPSLFESYGLPIVEAMAAGIPVLTADCYGTKEIAGDAALLVNPESVDSIAAGMSRIVNDEQLRTRLIAAGGERARNLTWQRCAQQTLAVLEGIAAKAQK